jgi:hypothetical protein
VPGLNGDEEPYGEWKVVGEPFVDREWRKNGDPRFDIAVLRIANDKDGKAIQDVVGFQRIRVTRVTAEQAPMSLYGYPGEGDFDGKTQESCVDRFDITLDDDILTMKPCDLTKGIGGGPWLSGRRDANDDDDRRDAVDDGAVLAVTIARSPDGNGLMGAPIDDIGDLIEAAEDATEDENDNDNEKSLYK